MSEYISPIADLASIGAAGYTVHSGERSAKSQRKSLRTQAASQAQAESAAMRQRQESQEAYNRANRRKPDIAGILAAARAQGEGGGGLLGLLGDNPGKLPLGGKSLLGS